MARDRGTDWLKVFFVVVIVGLLGAAIYYTLPFLSGETTNPEIQKAKIAADLEKARLKAVTAAERIAAIKLSVIVVASVAGVVSLIIAYLRLRAAKGKGGLSIEDIIRRGVKRLHQIGFYTRPEWAVEGNFQRREASTKRAVIVHFTDRPITPGFEGWSSHIRHVAVLNDDWDHRVLLPPGLSVLQAYEWLADLEQKGLSLEKTTEQGALEKLAAIRKEEETREELLGVIPT